MEKENDNVKGKLNYFLDENIKVHVTRTDKSFWNGFIIEKKADDVYIFNENKFGLVHLFVSDVHDVRAFKEVEE